VNKQVKNGELEGFAVSSASAVLAVS